MEVRIVKGSMGSFLDPPNSPQRQYRVIGWDRPHRTREPDFSMSLEGALDSDWISEGIKRRIQALYDCADMQPTEEWLSSVYGYFKNCYSPDGKDRNVSNCLIVRLAKQQPQREGERYRIGTFREQPYGDELPDPNKALAVMHIRKFFPDHEIREDLLINGKWGRQ